MSNVIIAVPSEILKYVKTTKDNGYYIIPCIAISVHNTFGGGNTSWKDFYYDCIANRTYNKMKNKKCEMMK